MVSDVVWGSGGLSRAELEVFGNIGEAENKAELGKKRTKRILKSEKNQQSRRKHGV